MTDLEVAVREEIEELTESGAGMTFVFSPTEAFLLLGVLQQFVLRHPELHNFGVANEFTLSLARNIEDRLCKTPALAEVARLGWDSRFDV